ncbi:MAG: general secretion pathway protein GspB [Proteobacteria bacterium]|nr:general secretion pathway protein GspB [Pseudomonadota bacterium]
MSFVLDALKKAASPQGDTVDAFRQSRGRQVPAIIWLLVAGLLINAAVVVAWQMGLFRSSKPAQMTPVSSPVQSPSEVADVPPGSTPAPAPAPSVVVSPPISREVPSQLPLDLPRQVADTSGTPRADAAPTARSKRSGTGPRPTAFADLSADRQARFPAFEYSTHVYTDEPSVRAVVINGVRLRQGDEIEALRLHEITESGVVFEFESELVEVSVLEAWEL